MTPGREVVEDYSHIGLTLRDHPLSFLREELQTRHVMTCADATGMRDGRLTRVAGLVLVRQKPGSAKGVMFITIEDETGAANLVIWPSLYEQQRRIVLSATMLAVDGKVQREGEVVHIVATKLHDASGLLASVGDRDSAFPLPHSRGDDSIAADRPTPATRRPVRSRRETSTSPIFTSTRSGPRHGISDSSQRVQKSALPHKVGKTPLAIPQP